MVLSEIDRTYDLEETAEMGCRCGHAARRRAKRLLNCMMEQPSRLSPVLAAATPRCPLGCQSLFLRLGPEKSPIFQLSKYS